MLSIRAMLLCSLTMAGAATFAQVPPNSAKIMNDAKAELRESRKEAAKNLDDGIRGKIKPSQIRRAQDLTPEAIQALIEDAQSEDAESEEEDFSHEDYQVDSDVYVAGAERAQQLTDQYVAALQAGDAAAATRIQQLMLENQQSVFAAEEADRAASYARSQAKAAKKAKPKPTPPANEDDLLAPLTPPKDNGEDDLLAPLTPPKDNSEDDLLAPLTPPKDNSEDDLLAPLTPPKDNSEDDLLAPLTPSEGQQ